MTEVRRLHRITVLSIALCLLAVETLPYCRAEEAGVDLPWQREKLSLDRGWRFHLGDVPWESFPGGQGIAFYGPDFTHHGAKAGHAWGVAARGFDDSAWRAVTLPHDFVLEQPFAADEERAQGYRKRGVAWYRRTFKLSDSDKGKNLEFRFDGVATHCTVFFNGTAVHRNWNGYTSFAIDVTTMARFGDDINTLAVRVDAEPMEGWWYEGGGIYRHVWLVKRNPLHVATDGLYANPVKDGDGTWTIPIEATIANTAYQSAEASVIVTVLDDVGNQIAEGRSAVLSLEPRGDAKASFPVSVASPRLWSVDAPNLYTVRATVLASGEPVDSVDATCGFRTIRFDPAEGFFLNERPLKLQGTCNHQDHAGVGVALPDSLWEFRVSKLKEMGSNAYRTTHNPPSKELLDVCDRLGMLVLDETRHFSTAPEHLRQLEWLVRRDRNHPCVIMWSLFNEEPLQVNREGMEMARAMDALVKRLDPTRPTTGGQNRGQLNQDGTANLQNAAQVLGVVGINYQAGDYDKIRAAYPDKPIVSTEDTSQVMTRGAYFTDYEKKIIASYDDVYPGWDRFSSVRNSWQAIETQPSFAGGFSWTGFDYRGEPTPFGWPSASSFFGAMDLCGFPKSEFFIRQAHWVKDRPVLTLVPHWNWPGMDGQKVRVMALTNADTVALSLNGVLIDEKRVDQFQMVEWFVPYAPGRLVAVAKNYGREVASYSVETTGEPVALRLTPDRAAVDGDGEDAVPVTVEALDDQGRPVPTSSLPVEFEIAGPGAVIGLGNGDPNSREPDQGLRRSLFNGLAQVILQSERGGSGALVLRVRGEGLKPAETTINVRAVARPPEVPVANQ
jgi:beta-galactosidase